VVIVNELVQWDSIDREIAEAKDIETLKGLSDKLEAIRVIARQSKQSLEVQNRIAEYRLRVERQKGEWLKENTESMNKGGNPNLSTDSTGWKLQDVGLSRDESSKAQRVAGLKPEDFENYIKEMKETNKEVTLSGVVKLAKQLVREEKIEGQKEELMRNAPVLPEGKFDVIVIDPPWRYSETEKYEPETRRGTLPYPSMSQEEMLKIEIPAKDDCILWLWTTNTHIRMAYELLEEWGFAPKSILTWDKVNMGTGYYLRSQTEHCILAVKGSPLWTNKKHSTLIREKRGEHSAKPDVFYSLVDEICFGSKLDYFARKKREGWTVFGDEVMRDE